MAKILIERKKQIFAPMNCCFRVYIDGEQEMTLQNGERDELTITEGVHHIQIQNNYFKSKERKIKVFENENIKFCAMGNPFVGWLYLFAPLVLLVYTSLRLLGIEMPEMASTIALIPFGIFIIILGFVYALNLGIIIHEES